MTRKETLYRELISLRNQLKDAEHQIDIEKLCRMRKYETYKIAELQKSIEYTKLEIKQMKEKEENQDFLENTEHGRQFLNEQTELRQEIVSNCEKVRAEFGEWVHGEINKMLGDRWTVNESDNRIEIGLKNTDPNRNFTFMFGHNFDIYFDWRKQLTANYGTMGSFDVMEANSTRIEFVTGMAKVLGNTEFQSELYKRFSEMGEFLLNSIREVKIIDDKINNAYKTLAIV